MENQTFSVASEGVVVSMLCISSSHLTMKTWEWLSNEAMHSPLVVYEKSEFGFIILIQDDIAAHESLPTVPDDLMEVYRFAHSIGAKWVMLDVDGYEICELAVYPDDSQEIEEGPDSDYEYIGEFNKRIAAFKSDPELRILTVDLEDFTLPAGITLSPLSIFLASLPQDALLDIRFKEDGSAIIEDGSAIVLTRDMMDNVDELHRIFNEYYHDAYHYTVLLT